MNNILKRGVAFIIDILVVMMIATSLSMISFINPYYNKYNEVVNEELELIESYNNEEISMDEYVDRLDDISYNIDKYSIYSNIIIIVVYLLYFVVFNYVTKGQTLGKKLFKLKIVDNSDKKSNPRIVKYLIRTLILYGLIFDIISIILINIISKDNYLDVSGIIYYIQSFVYLIIVIMVLIRIDGRGLHDMVAGTVVVDSNDMVEEDSNDEEVVCEKIIDVSYEEIKNRRKVREE